MINIKLVGIDPGRPTRLRKEAYLDLFFKLSEEPPTAWRDLFDTLGRRLDPVVKMDKGVADCISAWVSNMDLIAGHFDKIKQQVHETNELHNEKLRQQAQASSARIASSRDLAQERLDEILHGLEFDT